MIKNFFGVFGKAFTFLSSGNLLSDILALTVVALVLTGIYLKGRSDSSIACAERQSAGIEKNVKVYGQTKRTVTGMGESDIDSALMRWMRD